MWPSTKVKPFLFRSVKLTFLKETFWVIQLGNVSITIVFFLTSWSQPLTSSWQNPWRLRTCQCLDNQSAKENKTWKDDVQCTMFGNYNKCLIKYAGCVVSSEPTAHFFKITQNTTFEFLNFGTFYQFFVLLIVTFW